MKLQSSHLIRSLAAYSVLAWSGAALPGTLHGQAPSIDDVFVFVRSDSAAGCEPTHSVERVLVVVNKAPQSHTVELPTNESALAGCTEFQLMAPTLGPVPRLEGGNLLLDEAAESMTIYRVR